MAEYDFNKMQKKLSKYLDEDLLKFSAGDASTELNRVEIRCWHNHYSPK